MKTCAVQMDDGSICGRKHQARGMCFPHYQRFRADSPMGAPIKQRRKARPSGPTCRFASCGRIARKMGLCGTHWVRDLYAPERMSEPIEERRGWTHSINIPRAVMEGARAEASRRGLQKVAPILREWLQTGYEAWVEARRQEQLRQSIFADQRRIPRAARG